MANRRLPCFGVVLAALGFHTAAQAHNGPPFPIIVDRVIGSAKISLWTHPDIGIGYFFVVVDPLPGRSAPKDLKFRLGIQPVSNRLPEVIYDTHVEELNGEPSYRTDVTFDKQDFFRVRLLWQSKEGSGEADSQVEATPVGLGRWDLLLFALPFLGVGFLWFKVAMKKRASNK